MRYLAQFISKKYSKISIDFTSKDEESAAKIFEKICVGFSEIKLEIVYIYFGEYGKDVESGLIYEFFGNLNQENLPIILAGLK